MAPKKANLIVAQESLATTMALLNQKRAELKEVEDRLASLQKTLEEKTEEKAQLEFQVDLCARKLERAEKLIGGLGGEKSRFQSTMTNLRNLCSQLIPIFRPTEYVFLYFYTGGWEQPMIFSAHMITWQVMCWYLLVLSLTWELSLPASAMTLLKCGPSSARYCIAPLCKN